MIINDLMNTVNPSYTEPVVTNFEIEELVRAFTKAFDESPEFRNTLWEFSKKQNEVR